MDPLSNSGDKVAVGFNSSAASLVNQTNTIPTHIRPGALPQNNADAAISRPNNSLAPVQSHRRIPTKYIGQESSKETAIQSRSSSVGSRIRSSSSPQVVVNEQKDIPKNEKH